MAKIDSHELHQSNYQGLFIILGLPRGSLLQKSLLFGQNRLRKSARWRPPDFKERSKIVKKGHQIVYKVRQGNY